MDSGLICVEENAELGLRLFTYGSCNHSSPDDLKLNRSVIMDEDGRVVARSLPFTTEIEDLNTNEHGLDLSEYDIYPSIEGTLLRLFFWKDKWMLTTNRRLDAFKSYWSCHLSFGQLFVDHLARLFPDHLNYLMEHFTSTLKKNDTYFFLCQSNEENRVVCRPVDAPQLYYVGRYINGDSSILDSSPLVQEEDPAQKTTLPRVSRITATITSFDDARSYILDVIDPFEEQGLILYHKQKNEQVKLYHPQYVQYWKIRNNVPNLQQRYLEIRKDPDTLATFFVVYPKFRAVADRLEETILQISKFVYHAYVERFIRKRYVSIPKDMYHILKLAHQWHTQDRGVNKIYYLKIVEIVNLQDARVLLGMIRRFIKNRVYVS